MWIVFHPHICLQACPAFTHRQITFHGLLHHQCQHFHLIVMIFPIRLSLQPVNRCFWGRLISIYPLRLRDIRTSILYRSMLTSWCSSEQPGVSDSGADDNQSSLFEWTPLSPGYGTWCQWSLNARERKRPLRGHRFTECPHIFPNQ